MAIDRPAILRNAEKLLRQGKLEAAIAEYVRIVEDQPRDWATMNTLGDLYLRAKQPDKAIEQFVRIADNLSREGFLPKASAVYKKILKIRPDDEHALSRAGEIAAKQGVLVDARSYLRTVAEGRLARGDRKGAAEIRVRLGALDVADFEARRGAAGARLELGDTAGAAAEFQAMAADLLEKGRRAEAVSFLQEAAGLSPNDSRIHGQLFAVHLSAGDLSAARAHARSPDHFQTLGKAYLAAGRTEDAVEFLLSQSAGGDAQLILQVAEAKLSAGEFEKGLALLKQLLTQDPASVVEITRLGWEFARWSPDAGLRLIDVTTQAAVRAGDWASAAAALQEFARHVPHHVPALLRLVEICMDGHLEATLYSAQAQLADAYLLSGAATEARIISEDLVARQPDDPAHGERLRRALALLGGVVSHPAPPSPAPSPPQPLTEALDADAQWLIDLPVADRAPRNRKDLETGVEPVPALDSLPAGPDDVGTWANQFGVDDDADLDRFAHLEVSAADFDLDSMFANIERATTPLVPDDVEIDLSLLLDDFSMDEADAGESDPRPTSRSGPSGELAERVKGTRTAVSAGPGRDVVDREYERGIALREAGRIDESVQALQSAARAPKVRFRASASLGRIYREHGTLPQAIEWFEQAAEATPPTVEEGRELLYELAETLESAGEIARALAVCLELQADAGECHDLSARIQRLARAQARG